MSIPYESIPSTRERPLTSGETEAQAHEVARRHAIMAVIARLANAGDWENVVRIGHMSPAELDILAEHERLA